MMTDEQRHTVSIVYSQLSTSDGAQTDRWTDIDECMSTLDWLEDNQLVIESEVIYDIHKLGKPRCGSDHPIEHCFVPMIIDAVVAIINLHKETQNLHPKNRFILQMYLSLTKLGEILAN